MNRFYLKIPYAIRSWYPGVAPSDWRESIFNDVTEHGKRLVIERLAANGHGDRLALHGDKFYLQVGRDSDRTDSLYAIRLEPAENNLPRSTPISHACDIALWHNGHTEPRDPIGPLFGGAATPREPDDDTREADAHQMRADAPSPLFVTVLPQAPAATRAAFRPCRHLRLSAQE